MSRDMPGYSIIMKPFPDSLIPHSPLLIPIINNLLVRQECTSLGLRVNLKPGHTFYLPLFFDIPKPFLAPGGLSAECVQVSVM